jgi:hypothetical protein
VFIIRYLTFNIYYFTSIYKIPSFIITPFIFIALATFITSPLPSKLVPRCFTFIISLFITLFTLIIHPLLIASCFYIPFLVLRGPSPFLNALLFFKSFNLFSFFKVLFLFPLLTNKTYNNKRFKIYSYLK